MTFSGEAKKVQLKNVGGKSLLEFSLCSKNYTKAGDPEKWTWLRVNVWDPKEWLLALLHDGVFVSGIGEFTTRSYDASTGEKKMEAEVRCSGFDLDVARPPLVKPSEAETVRLPVRAPAKFSDAPEDDHESPPF